MASLTKHLSMARQTLRIGQGIDIHAFEDGRRCVLGGVEIPHHRGLAGHSDADVLIHAIMDALLGAMGEPDIGHLFPNVDARWKNANSLDMLAEVHGSMQAHGWELVNLDCSVLAEEPKISPHVPAMKERIAQVLHIAPQCIGIKATTTEGLGCIGRREGVLACAVALLSHE